MHDHQAIVLISFLILIFGIFSKLSERSPVSGPMVFVAAGLLVSLFAGFELHAETEMVKFVAELTLIIILFVDGSLIRVSNLRNVLSGLPARLLFIGLPLTAILGTISAQILFPDWGIWSILLLALILTPTDAALGQAVVKSSDVPDDLRQSISIESGLNDGIVLPPILVCIAVLASGGNELAGDGHWLKYLALQLTLGPLIGGLIGHFGGRLVDYASSKHWMESSFQRLSAIALAILAFSIAESFHGNGFIAAFVAGLALGVKDTKVLERIQEFGEAQGQLLSLSIFLLLGIMAIPTFYPYWGVSSLVYAILSLTVIRMLPVILSLIGSGLDNYSKFFVAWFGPRGIASILYLLIVIGDLGITGYEEVLSVIVLTVFISVFAHGLTAVTMSKRFTKKNR